MPVDRIPLYASELFAHVRERYPQLLQLIATLPPDVKLPQLIRRAVDEIIQEFNSRLDENGYFVPDASSSSSASATSAAETRPEVEQLMSQLNRVESEHSRRIDSSAYVDAPAVGSHIRQVLDANAADAVLPKDEESDPKHERPGQSRAL